MGSRDNTYSEIAYWVPKYILCRGTRKFGELGAMSPRMRQLAASLDRIGWRNFMEGRVSKHFYSIQQLHLTVGESYLSGDDWMKHFITRLLHIRTRNGSIGTSRYTTGDKDTCDDWRGWRF